MTSFQISVKILSWLSFHSVRGSHWSLRTRRRFTRESIGGKCGRGFASCGSDNGGWTAPAGMKIEGGSFRFQVGGAESDVIILVMNKSGSRSYSKASLRWVVTLPRLPDR